MKYKALLIDVDGTLILNQRDAIPSKRVTEAIEKASKVLHVGIATSRCYTVAEQVINHLKLNGPSVLNGGAQVVMFPSGEFSYEYLISTETAREIRKYFLDKDIQFTVCDGINPDIPFTKGQENKNACMIYAQKLDETQVNEIVRSLSNLPDTSIHTTRSWQIGKTDVLITHARATKQHGILEVAKLLGIETSEIIGIGDGYNDFPLLMACGLKVAMGNAVEDLKAIADYIAPTVEDDGVADVIDKFVLHHND